MKNGKFWFVWNEKRDVPARKHGGMDWARKEARRLSDKRPGEIFYILESVGIQYKPTEDSSWIKPIWVKDSKKKK